MKINVQSIKFDADQKLLDFIDKKVGKLEKFFDNIISCDVADSASPATILSSRGQHLLSRTRWLTAPMSSRTR